MQVFRKVGGWILALLLWLWTTAPKLADWIGRSTLQDDWEKLMLERLPEWASWLFGTPWQVPATLASLLTAYMIWLSWPQAEREPVDPRRDTKDLEQASHARIAELTQKVASLEAGRTGGSEATQSSPPIAFPRGLVLIDLGLDVRKDDDDPAIEVWVRAYNASGAAVNILGVNGFIDYQLRSESSSLGGGQFTSFSIMYDRTKINNIANLSEIFVVMRHRLSRAIAGHIQDCLESGEFTMFATLRSFDIKVGLYTNPNESTRLPIWEMVSVDKKPRMTTHFINTAHADLQA